MLLPIAREPLLPPLSADRLLPGAPPGSKDVCIDEDEAADELEPADDEPLPAYKSFFMA